MQENTYIANVIESAGSTADVDDATKEILSDKSVLAWIMSRAVEEFKGYSIEVIKECIEGEPEISKVSVDPGLTNEAITGDDTEDKVQHEGKVHFDIRFTAITPDKKRIKVIINVEAQKNFYPGYDLVTRGVYYGARLISSQKNREFIGTNYDDIKKVYSIWICLNAPAYARNTITEYSMQPTKLYGDYKGRARYDLLSVIMICLGNPDDNLDEDDEYQKLLRLLSVLASHRIEPRDKFNILEEEFHIATTMKLEEGVNSMCNWSEGIAERILEDVKKEFTEKITEEVTERVTEEVTERVTEEVTERVTEEVTEKATRAAFEESIRNVMQALNVSLEKACEILKINVVDYTSMKL